MGISNRWAAHPLRGKRQSAEVLLLSGAMRRCRLVAMGTSVEEIGSDQPVPSRYRLTRLRDDHPASGDPAGHQPLRRQFDPRAVRRSLRCGQRQFAARQNREPGRTQVFGHRVVGHLTGGYEPVP